MAVKEKKRIQVQIDKELANDTEQVLDKLGLTPTTAINMFYKRIVATGSLPFQPTLTPGEKATLHFFKQAQDIPVTKFKNAHDVKDWLNDSNED
ncbi:type II toxin-antitoxin system RelB/DinJ family antitoxin [Lentilactobacillus raoultii]|uniref:Type II toxin-antitoxin system RelB/DinJ family antitoxin n=1 Tax=Lentilactobacillus raoultii TaxID=1987503 RepID=A0ABW3PPB9_9LACO|nr:type II toxin-antitoxin system RelB/DinJ family antitoxin [Lentilactobacillus raoultii]